MAHATKTDAADAETAHISTGATAQIAAVFLTRRELCAGRVLTLGFCDFACLRHYESLS
jgi:hypothetical protein